MNSAWTPEGFNKDIANANIKTFLIAMENPNKTATRAQFEQVEKDFKTFIEQRLAQ